MSTRSKDFFRLKLNSISSEPSMSGLSRSSAHSRSRSCTYAGSQGPPDSLRLKKFKTRLRKFFSDPGNDDIVLQDTTSNHSNEDVFTRLSQEDTEHGDPSSSRQKTNNVFGPSNTPDNGKHSFLQKRIPPSIRRAKSVKSTGKENRPMAEMTSLIGQGANLRNTDVNGTPSLFMPAIESPEALDLTGDEDAIVRPLHYSILGKEHCFEVITRGIGSRCFSCESEGERESWIEKIKRTLNPNLDNATRIEHHLTLGVQEAKGLPTKKRYFCEICLDQQLYARTTSKWKNDNTVLWGESFDFTSIPPLKNITVHLYKDTDKKKKKDKDYMGLVNLSVATLNNDRADLGKWYNLSTPSGNNRSKTGEQMAIRIKARFQSVQVLPTEMYKPFAEFISTNYMQMCDNLKHVLTVSQKDELAKLLVRIMYDTGSIKEYMTELVMHEIDKVEEESLIFRENTIGTKSVEAFLRLVGMNYLNKTLGEFVKTLFDSDEDFEVDESRLPPQATLQQNQTNLQMCCKIALHQIVTSIQSFPSEMHEVFSTWRSRCEANDRPRIATRLITASLFLRLLCPAILNPSLFGLAYEMPAPKTARALTLVAKVIQNLANRSRFGNKEEYMKFMDVFIRDQWDQMGDFINDISDKTKSSSHRPGFDGFIDLGKELAKLHSFFAELMPTLEENNGCLNNLDGFKEIIEEISEQLKKPVEQIPIVKLDKILETTPKSSTPLAERRPLGGSPGHSASMMDMHEFRNISDYSPNFQINGSTTSIPSNSYDFNNSNNAPPSSYLASTENLPQITRPYHHSQSMQAPLSFSNPAYQTTNQQSSVDTQKQIFHRGLSSPACLSTLALSEPQTDPTIPSNDVSNKFTEPCPKPRSKGQAPLSFHNPLQQFQQHHLETVFTTETTTYRTPVAPVYTPTYSQKKANGDKGSSPDISSSEQDSVSPRESSASDGESSTLSETLNKNQKTSMSPPRHQKVIRTSSNQCYATKEEPQILQAATASTVSISSAHLKTGLQKQTHNSVTPTESPRRRMSSQTSKSSRIPTKKPTPTNHQHQNLNNNNKPSRTSTQPHRYQPSFQLSTTGSQGVTLELKDDPITVSTSSSQAKTSPTKQAYSSRNNQARSSKANVKSASQSSTAPLHLSTPEDQLTPEERTAQWILNNSTPTIDPIVAKHNSHGNSDKEVDMLHKELNEIRTERDHTREVLMAQLHSAEKRENRLQEKLRQFELMSIDKDKQIKNISQRLNHLERENNDLRDRLEDSKTSNVSQRKRISQLEIANARLLRNNNQLRGSTGSNMPPAAHAVARRQRSRNHAATAPIINSAQINGSGDMHIDSDGSSSA